MRGAYVAAVASLDHLPMALMIFIGIPASAAAVADPMRRLWVPKSSAGSLSECSVLRIIAWSLGLVSREPFRSQNIASDLCACFLRYRNCFVICTGQMSCLLAPIMMVAPLLN